MQANKPMRDLNQKIKPQVKRRKKSNKKTFFVCKTMILNTFRPYKKN